MPPIGAFNKETFVSVNARAHETMSLPGLGESKLIGAEDGGLVALELDEKGATIDFGKKGSITLAKNTVASLHLPSHQVVTIEPWTITATETPKKK